jgi:hypothetical protein
MTSRNKIEGTYSERRSYFKRRRIVFRVHGKSAKLAVKGTLRAITNTRLDAIFHMMGVKEARIERRNARKQGKEIHFKKGDLLRVVNNLDEEGDVVEGMRIDEIVAMEDRSSELRPFIIVKRRNGRRKQLEKSRFILHARFIELAVNQI